VRFKCPSFAYKTDTDNMVVLGLEHHKRLNTTILNQHKEEPMDQWHEDFEDETIPVEFLESELDELDWLESQSTIIPELLMVSSEEIPF